MNAAVEQKVELVLKKVKGEAGRKFREMNENQRNEKFNQSFDSSRQHCFMCNVLACSDSSDTDVTACDMYGDIYGEQQRAQGFHTDALRHLKSAQVCKQLTFFSLWTTAWTFWSGRNHTQR